MNADLQKLRTIQVKVSAIQAAIARAQREHADWQAQPLEILLIPKVLRRWRQVNPRYTWPTITRHPGFPEPATRAARDQVEDWSSIRGYAFTYGPETSWRWNSVRDDYYGHSPGTCWDGVRRETNHSFLESLRDVWYHLERGETPHWRVYQNLDQYRIQVVDDVGGHGPLNVGR